jgi:hypothetical protein
MDRDFDAWFQRALADPPDGVCRIPRRRSRSTATGALSFIATGFASSVFGSHIGLATGAPPSIRNSAISTYKTLSCFMVNQLD